MKASFLVLFYLIVLSSFSKANELPVFKPEDLLDSKVQDSSEIQLKEEKKEERAINYIAFINEIIRFRKSTNQLRTEYDVKKLTEEAMNQIFLFRDTVRVKRNMLVSGDLGCWFEPVSDLEVFVKFPKEMIQEFLDLQEYDYLSCYARLIEYRGKMIFKVEKIISIEPFDPTADFIELNQKIDEIAKQRVEMEYFKFKDELSQFAIQHEGKLGIITGKMISLIPDPNTNEVVMKMDYGDLPIEIVCHPDYLDVLLDLRFNSRISMAVILESVDPRKGYRFTRGCMVQLRDVNATK